MPDLPISGLPAAASLAGTEPVPTVQAGVTVKTTAAAIAALAVDVDTLAGDVTGPIGSNVLSDTAVTPGSYTATNLTVDSKGRITAAANGSAGTTYSAGAGLTLTSTTFSTNGQESYATQTVTTTATIDFSTARVNRLVLTGASCAITLTGSTASVACGVTVYLVQDGTGGRVVTWPGSLKWPGGGVAPTLTTTANGIDLVVLETFDNGASWYGNLAGKNYV